MSPRRTSAPRRVPNRSRHQPTSFRATFAAFAAIVVLGASCSSGNGSHRIAGSTPSASASTTAPSPASPAGPTARPPSAATPGPTAATARPNIIFILTDDQRYDTLAQMPNVRRLLGGHGVTFTNAFVSTSLCCPSRASILTGEYSHNTGVLDNIPPNGGVTAFHDSSTIATWLHAGGYRTSLIGKYLNGYKGAAIPPGWDDWHAYGGSDEWQVFYDYRLNENGKIVSYGAGTKDYLTTVLFERAKSFIAASRKPYFLYLAPSAPHTPAIPAKQDVGTFSSIPPYRPPSFNEDDLGDKPWGSTIPPMTQQQIDNADAYRESALASLQAVDRGVASLLDLVRSRRQLDNTIIVFTSDNGYMLGEHRLVTKQWAYEPSIRVPLVFRLPWQATARTDDHLVLNVDLPNTFAALAHVRPRLRQNGEDLTPLLQSRTVAWRNEVYLEFLATIPAVKRPPPYRAIRTTRWKYIAFTNGWRELYDLSRDPDELDNLAGRPGYETVEAELGAKLARLAKT